jgi:eukaryotic-like serine/threonine-protein kinase
MLRKIRASRILSLVSELHAGMMVTPSVRLLRPLGEGGMGTIWVADHLALRTQVVVKFIAKDLKSSKEALDRFSREAAAAAQVKSPHVVQTHDYGVDPDGVPYIIMELLEGQDLGGHLDQVGKLRPELVLEIVIQLARALDRAHERGIVHRDIKPGNIFLCDGGSGEVFVKLLDFGIAKGVESPSIDSNTKTGSMIGSPFYMSPEQILGSKSIDHRSDLWSVGIVVFEALTGSKPFDAETMGGLAIKIHSEPLPLPTAIEPTLPPAVDAWFLRACSRNVEERFRSAKEMAEGLAGALGGQMPRSFDMPRLSTGPSDVAAGAPTLVAGATTEAGVVRSMTQARTRNRVLGLVGVLLLGAASFVVVRTVQAPSANADARGIVAADPPPPKETKVHAATTPADVAPLALSAAVPAAGNVEESVPPPGAPGEDVAPADPAARAGGETPAPPTTKASGRHGPRPRPKDTGHAASPSLPTATTTAAPPPKPTATGHDIF